MKIEKTTSVEFELPFDPKKKIFATQKELSRDILQYFKDKGLLPYVLPEFFPEKFTSRIIINQHSQKNETAYVVRFHLDLKISEISQRATKEMEKEVARFKNRSLDETEDKKLKFLVELPKKSRLIKVTKEKITLTFI